jgi:creatinine amidohydrolase
VPAGVLLENLSWVEAEASLTSDSIVVIPLGAALKEHGPHLKLNNDWVMAEYLKKEIVEREKVVVAPTVPYFYYPAFVEYPGSVSLALDTARDTIIQLCTSLAAFGPRRFYVINTGISTMKALGPAAEHLAGQGMLLHYTDLDHAIAATAREVGEQEGGSHADEIETSIMLAIAPDLVDMAKAVKDFDKTGHGILCRERTPGKTHSPSGIWGDASLASVEKGNAVVKSLVAAIVNDIHNLRHTDLPADIEESRG